MSTEVTQILIKHFCESHNDHIIGSTFASIEPTLTRMYNIGLLSQAEISEFKDFMTSPAKTPKKE